MMQRRSCLYGVCMSTLIVVCGVCVKPLPSDAGSNPMLFGWELRSTKRKVIRRRLKRGRRVCRKWSYGGDGTRSCRLQIMLRGKAKAWVKSRWFKRQLQVMRRDGDVRLWLLPKAFARWRAPKSWRKLKYSTKTSLYYVLGRRGERIEVVQLPSRKAWQAKRRAWRRCHKEKTCRLMR